MLCPVRRLSTVSLGLVPVLLVVIPACGAAQLGMARWERGRLYHDFAGTTHDTSALLVLHVRNDTNRVIASWKALLVVRDTEGRQQVRLALRRDSADLAPGDVQRFELQFADDPSRSDDPFDFLWRHDTTDMQVVLDQVEVTLGPEIAYARAGAPICFTRGGLDRLRRAQRGTQTLPDACQRLVSETTVLLLERLDGGWKVRLERMSLTAFLLEGDLRTPEARR